MEVLETGLNSAALWKGATGLCQLHFAHTSVSVGTQVTLVSALSRSPCHSCWMTTSPSCSTSICGTSGCKGQECLREFPVPWLLLFCLLFESPWLLLDWLYKKKKKKKGFIYFYNSAGSLGATAVTSRMTHTLKVKCHKTDKGTTYFDSKSTPRKSGKTNHGHLLDLLGDCKLI